MASVQSVLPADNANDERKRSRPPLRLKISVPKSVNKLSSDSYGRKRSVQEEELRKENKRFKAALVSSTEEYICPISHELMLDPVIAEDEGLYEREEIEKVLKMRPGRKFRSPRTGLMVGKTLIAAPSVRNSIDFAVESGAVETSLANNYLLRKHILETTRKAERGDCKAMHYLSSWYRLGLCGLLQNEEKAELWLKKEKDAKDAKFIQALASKSERGDPDAMYRLGICHCNGTHGLTKSYETAFHWLHKSADNRNPKAMALFGEFCLRRGPDNNTKVEGCCWIKRAAEEGSARACFILGKALFYYSPYDLPQNKQVGICWLKKCMDGSCIYKDLPCSFLEEAKKITSQEEEKAQIKNTK